MSTKSIFDQIKKNLSQFSRCFDFFKDFNSEFSQNVACKMAQTGVTSKLSFYSGSVVHEKYSLDPSIG
jgi:hypothetical protein